MAKSGPWKNIPSESWTEANGLKGPKKLGGRQIPKKASADVIMARQRYVTGGLPKGCDG